MENENQRIELSPTVLNVIKQFAAAMRADGNIQNDAIDRLEKLLLKGTVPKYDEINSTFFETPPDSMI
jgi:hypothetical protein